MKEQVVYLATTYTFTLEQLREKLLECFKASSAEGLTAGFAGVYSRNSGKVYYKIYTKNKDAFESHFPSVFSPMEDCDNTVVLLKNPPHDVDYDRSMLEVIEKVKNGYFGENLYVHEKLHKELEGLLNYLIDQLCENESDRLKERINLLTSYDDAVISALN